MYEMTEQDIYTLVNATISSQILSNAFDTLFYGVGMSVDKLESLSDLILLLLKALGIKYTTERGDLDTDVISNAVDVLNRNIAEYGHSRDEMHNIAPKICKELKEIAI